MRGASALKLNSDHFKKQLQQFIQFRGIDIMLYLKDGTTIELDKNRQMDGDVVIKMGRDGVQASISLDEIVKADFFAA
ncbi:MAG: hypothetical protein H7A21_03280 [Spirochaetales bacterium]|nr:hypothetical protein [Leptospiraceae bacterium]MCP5480431.1 hypothetical protein [Spirochaetales bacterium]